LLTSLKNRSFTSICDDDYPTMFSTAAFDFWDFEENDNFISIIEDGLKCFEDVYGYKSNYFTPPVYNIHHSLFKTLKANGIDFIDLGLIRKEHQGFGKYVKEFNYIGKQSKENISILVRNIVLSLLKIEV